jgi:hypothetical protein
MKAENKKCSLFSIGCGGGHYPRLDIKPVLA